MNKTELSKKTSEFFVTINAKNEKWKSAVEKSQEELIKKVTIKGFRKGNAPRDLALKQLKKSDIYSHAIKELLPDLGKEAAKEITKEIMVIDSPTYIVEKVDDNQLEIKFVYPVYPEIKLSNYKSLNVKYNEKKVDEKIIEQELEKIKKAKVSKAPKTGKIAKGDMVNFDFEGFVDKEPFQGGKAEKFDLEIGSGQFIPGFEDQMIGLEKGQKAEVNVTFPETYHVENLKGKPALFKVKINEVSTKKAPKLDDAFVKTLEIKDVDTVAKLRNYLKEIFSMQFKQEARVNFQRETFDKLLKDTEFTIPAALIAKEMKAVAGQMQQDLKKQNLTIEQYMKLTKMDQTKLSAEFRNAATKRLNDAFVFAEIARQEKIKLEDADYEAEYKKLAKVYRSSVEGIKGMVTKEQMQIPMTNDRVIDILIKHNTK